MNLLTIDNPPIFARLGPSVLSAACRGSAVIKKLPADRLMAREMLHDACPLTPGVYAWLDEHQQICYVGKSKSLRKRLLSYFAKHPSDDKADQIRRHSRHLVWEPVSHELLALIREQELIYRWRPDFNTQGQPTRRQPAFLGISGGVAPKVFMTQQLSKRAQRLFGPVAGTGWMRNAVNSISQVFGLRDCPDQTGFEFADQLRLFADPSSAKCIRYELETCSGPCAGFCGSSEYQSQVAQLINFLEGRDLTVLARIEQQMVDAADQQRYERAAALRDHLKNLNWLQRKMTGIRSARIELHGVLALPGNQPRPIWILLNGGRLIGSLPSPQNHHESLKATEKLERVAAARVVLPQSLFETHVQLILSSWLRKNTDLRGSLIPFPTAIERCQKSLNTT